MNMISVFHLKILSQQSPLITQEKPPHRPLLCHVYVWLLMGNRVMETDRWCVWAQDTAAFFVFQCLWVSGVCMVIGPPGSGVISLERRSAEIWIPWRPGYCLLCQTLSLLFSLSLLQVCLGFFLHHVTDFSLWAFLTCVARFSLKQPWSMDC